MKIAMKLDQISIYSNLAYMPAFYYVVKSGSNAHKAAQNTVSHTSNICIYPHIICTSRDTTRMRKNEPKPTRTPSIIVSSIESISNSLDVSTTTYTLTKTQCRAFTRFSSQLSASFAWLFTIAFIIRLYVKRQVHELRIQPRLSYTFQSTTFLYGKD